MIQSQVETRYHQWGKARVRPTVLGRDAARSFDTTLWQELGDTGMFSTLSASAGDRPRGTRDFVHALHGLARGSLDIPFAFTAVAHALGLILLERHGSREQRAAYMAELVSGRRIAAVSNAEQAAGTDIRGMKSTMTVGADGRGTLRLVKPLVTNVPAAGLLTVSAWTTASGEKPRIDVYLLEAGPEVRQTAVTDVAGLWTGTNGSVAIDAMVLDVARHRLGRVGGGLTILRDCFDLERLLVASVVTGALAGLVDEALVAASAGAAFGKALKEFQYVQEKVIQIYRASAELGALIATLLADGPLDLLASMARWNKELALLKWKAAEDGLASAVAHYEILGASGYRHGALAQKILRDMLALKALGGTKELQKNVIFEELLVMEQGNADKDGEAAKDGRKTA